MMQASDWKNTQIPPEWYDLVQILENGAAKHGPNTWLRPDNASLQHVSNHNSMFHHLADSYNNITEDHESGLHPLLHLACRALMEYTRWKRGI